MEASHLRIGNLVTINNPDCWPEEAGKPMEVTGITRTQYIEKGEWFSINVVSTIGEWPELFSQYEKFIEPIPLTAEWLERFGFEKDSEITFHICSNNNHLVYIYFEKVRNCYAMIYNATQFCVIEHVHQLQNLYWCLCGEELKINL